MNNCGKFSRRELISLAAGALATAAFSDLASGQEKPAVKAVTAPSSPVAIGRCDSYDAGKVQACLHDIFDKTGSLASLVRGKTVTIKINATGGMDDTDRMPPVREFQTHPEVVRSVVGLLGSAGAARIRIVESASWNGPLEQFLHDAKWDLQAIKAAGKKVEFENTRNLGNGKEYVRLEVPGGGLIFPAYYLNHSYIDTDVFISISKLKSHAIAGITLSMKNLFGITPNSLYGTDAGNSGNENATGARSYVLHNGWLIPPVGITPPHKKCNA